VFAERLTPAWIPRFFTSPRTDPRCGRIGRLHRPAGRVRGAKGHLRVFAGARRSLCQGHVQEPEFQAASTSRGWQAFPIGLANGAEVVEGTLRRSPTREYRQREALVALVLAIFRSLPGAGGDRGKRVGASCAPSSTPANPGEKDADSPYHTEKRDMKHPFQSDDGIYCDVR